MARSKENLLLDQFSGRIGNLIVKSYKYGAVLSKRPDMSKAGKTPKQEKARLMFKAAQAFAKNIISDTEKKKDFEKHLKPGQTVYHSAISFYMKSNPDNF